MFRTSFVTLLLALFTTSAFADVAPPRPPRPVPQPPPRPETRAVERDFVITGLDRYENVGFVLVLYRGGEFKASKLLVNDVPFEPFDRKLEREGVGQPSWRLFAIFGELPEKPEDINADFLADAEKLSMGLARQFKSYTWQTTDRNIARERITYKVSIVTDDEVQKLTIERTKRQLFNDEGDVIRTEEGDGDDDGDGLPWPADDVAAATDSSSVGDTAPADDTSLPVPLFVALAALALLGLVAVTRRR